VINGVGTLFATYVMTLRESITTDSATLWLRKSVGPFARTSRFPISDVSNFRPSRGIRNFFNSGTIVFDCHGKTYSLGERLQTDQVKDLVAFLKHHAAHP